MNKALRILAATALTCMVAAGAAGCGKDDSAASGTPVPTQTQAPMIVVTPAPTPLATPTPETSSESTSSSSSESSASSSSSSSSSSNGVLKREMEGDDVTEVQERLQALGYLDKVTGYFGTDTERAVRDFQERNNLDVDGKVGPATLEALMSESARQAS